MPGTGPDPLPRLPGDWLAAIYEVRYAVSGLTDLLHRLGYSDKLTTAVPGLADAAKQTAFRTATLAPLLAQAQAGRPLMNGLAFLRTLRQPTQTIITTAYREYAYEGYELDVLDYLLNPFSYERFAKAVGRLQPAATTPAPDEQHLLLKDQGSLFKVPCRDILYVEGCKDYVKVVTAAKTHLHHATMKEMAELLGADFARVHRSFIVSAAHLRLLQPEQVVLTDGTTLPIGQSYKPGLLVWFKR